MSARMRRRPDAAFRIGAFPGHGADNGPARHVPGRAAIPVARMERDNLTTVKYIYNRVLTITLLCRSFVRIYQIEARIRLSRSPTIADENLANTAFKLYRLM